MPIVSYKNRMLDVRPDRLVRRGFNQPCANYGTLFQEQWHLPDFHYLENRFSRIT